MATAKKNPIAETQENPEVRALNEKIELAFANLTSASVNAVKANKALASALDAVIPLAIEKTIKTRNCASLTRIIVALRTAELSIAKTFVNHFIEYCHADTGLAMTDESVWFIKGLNRFGCDPDAMTQWFAGNPNRLENAVKFSQWTAAKKAKKVQTAQEKFATDAQRVLKTIADYDLARNSIEYKNLVDMLKHLANIH